ncbi:f362c55c-b005-4c35-b655-9d125ffb7173 [Sclerotinia trifoliorum]|uniref:F362c55c-b005-4c35-b655-9d125ffb7173 n=1 Tax=Sclerotinia trifoliorum TaxID=28548 RepID=A0A8H2VSJ3_9HELO|nr:f362c55c-b005-4c35-b655-9d125ffb7173 [Sclerotinia trifoliorum]
MNSSDSNSDGKRPCNFQETSGPTTRSAVLGPFCWTFAPTERRQMPDSIIEYILKYFYEPRPLPRDVYNDLDCPKAGPHLERYDNLDDIFLHFCWDVKNKLRDEINDLKKEHDDLNRNYAALLNQFIGSSAVEISSESWKLLNCDAGRPFDPPDKCVCCNCFRLLEHSLWETLWKTHSLVIDLDFLRIEHQELVEKYAWLRYKVRQS